MSMREQIPGVVAPRTNHKKILALFAVGILGGAILALFEHSLSGVNTGAAVVVAHYAFYVVWGAAIFAGMWFVSRKI